MRRRVDSKNPDGSRLHFSATAWHAFLAYATTPPVPCSGGPTA
ncbi:DUF397 domain-containing protein [Streptomyces sp. LZ34]